MYIINKMLLSGGSIYTPSVVRHVDLIDKGVNDHKAIDNFISSKGQSEGLAPLVGNKIPVVHLPTSSNEFKGLWNAQTNTPTLADNGVGGITGHYYIVNVTGTTIIDGVNTWQVGDWIIHTGSVWERVDNPDPALIDVGAEYKTVLNKPIKNDTTPTDPKHLTQKDYVDGKELNLQNQITSNDNDILALNNKTQKLDASGNVLVPVISYSSAPIIGNPNDIVHKDYVDGKELNLQNQITNNDLDITNLQNQITSNDNDITALNNKTQNIQLATVTETEFKNVIIDDVSPAQITAASNRVLTTREYVDQQDGVNASAISNNASAISTIQGEQITQNTNISNNASAISTIQGEQTTQNNNISNNASSISTLNNKTQKLDATGNVSSLINYTSAQTFNNPLEIVSKDYVDSKTQAIQGALRYCGTYNATTNTPDLISAGPYSEGCYHVVSVNGIQNLNGTGNIDLGVGDWIVRNPTQWDVIEDSKTEIANLELKTQIFNTNGEVQANQIIPWSNAAVNLGDGGRQWLNLFVSNNANLGNVITSKILNTTGATKGIEFLANSEAPIRFTGNDYSTNLDRGLLTVDTTTPGEQGRVKKNNVASLSDLGDLKINGGELVKTTFSNDQEIVSKKYIDDANLSQGANITTLQNKTQKLDTSGNIQTSITPSTDNAIDLGTNLIRFKDGYYSNILRTDTTLNANNLLNTSNNVGINITNDVNGQISFNSTALYADGNANRAPIIDGTGIISKSGVVINNQNIECKDILCQKIVGNTGGPNDLVLENQAGVGVIIKDGATGNLCLGGSAYTANVGKYLKIDDNKGLIVADTIPTGGDVNGAVSSTDNAVARFDLTTGKLLQNSTVLISDTGTISDVLSIEPTGNENVVFGVGANNSGLTNVCLSSASGTGNTGSNGIFIGAGSKNGSGNENISIGNSAGSNALTGFQNICIGSGSGSNNLTNNNDCIYIGRGFNNVGNAGANNMIAIGLAITRRANEAVIGSSATTHIRPNADNHCDLGFFDGVNNAQFKNIFISGGIYVNNVLQSFGGGGAGGEVSSANTTGFIVSGSNNTGNIVNYHYTKTGNVVEVWIEFGGALDTTVGTPADHILYGTNLNANPTLMAKLLPFNFNAGTNTVSTFGAQGDFGLVNNIDKTFTNQDVHFSNISPQNHWLYTHKNLSNDLNFILFPTTNINSVVAVQSTLHFGLQHKFKYIAQNYDPL